MHFGLGCEPLHHVSDRDSFGFYIGEFCNLHAVTQFTMFCHVVCQFLPGLVFEIACLGVKEFVIVDGRCVSCFPYYAADCVWVISQYVPWQEPDDVVRQALPDGSFDLASFFCWVASRAGSGSGVRVVVGYGCASIVREYISNASNQKMKFDSVGRSSWPWWFVSVMMCSSVVLRRVCNEAG